MIQNADQNAQPGIIGWGDAPLPKTSVEPTPSAPKIRYFPSGELDEYVRAIAREEFAAQIAAAQDEIAKAKSSPAEAIAPLEGAAIIAGPSPGEESRVVKKGGPFDDVDRPLRPQPFIPPRPIPDPPAPTPEPAADVDEGLEAGWSVFIERYRSQMGFYPKSDKWRRDIAATVHAARKIDRERAAGQRKMDAARIADLENKRGAAEAEIERINGEIGTINELLKKSLAAAERNTNLWGNERVYLYERAEKAEARVADLERERATALHHAVGVMTTATVETDASGKHSLRPWTLTDIVEAMKNKIADLERRMLDKDKLCMEYTTAKDEWIVKHDALKRELANRDETIRAGDALVESLRKELAAAQKPAPLPLRATEEMRDAANQAFENSATWEEIINAALAVAPASDGGSRLTAEEEAAVRSVERWGWMDSAPIWTVIKALRARAAVEPNAATGAWKNKARYYAAMLWDSREDLQKSCPDRRTYVNAAMEMVPLSGEPNAATASEDARLLAQSTLRGVCHGPDEIAAANRILSAKPQPAREAVTLESETDEQRESDGEKYHRTIAVDFDGVIHAYSQGWHDGSIYDEPIPGTIEAMKKLRADGWRLLIYSARVVTTKTADGIDKAQLSSVQEWLQKWGVEHDEIWLGRGKPTARIYLDDRGLRFMDWASSLAQIAAIQSARGEKEGKSDAS